MTLALTIFILVLVTQIISWIGQSVLEEYVFAAHQRLFNSKRARQQRQLKTEILATKADLTRTSAQDEFAKWAKLRRKVDKGLADLEKLNSEMASARTSFSLKFKTGLWILTSGSQWVLAWWYSKKPVFYLPPGWLGPLTWWLSFPFAPAGSVSCGVWQFACRRVIRMSEDLFKEVVAAIPSKSRAQPVPATTDAPVKEKEL